MAIRKKKVEDSQQAPSEKSGGAAVRAADNRDRLKAMAEVMKGIPSAKPASEMVRDVTVVPTIFPLFDTCHVGGFPLGRLAIIQGESSAGKALKNGTPVLTSNGWKPIEKLHVGEKVAGKDGLFYDVLGVYPQGEKELYTIKFSDGSEVDCSGDHLWFTTTKREYKKGMYTQPGPHATRVKVRTGVVGKGSVKNTEEIIATLDEKHWIDSVRPIEYEGNDEHLLLDPYFLGLLLGDGGFSETTPSFHKPEEDLLERVKIYSVREGDEVTPRIRDEKLVGYRIRGMNVRKKLESLGLWGLHSYDKFIPPQYLIASPQKRLDLLKGILDTDGSVARGSIEFSTSSDKLAEGVVDLSRSLGAIVSHKERTSYFTYKGVKKEGRKSHRIVISFENVIPVSSKKHLDKWNGRGDRKTSGDRRYIVSVSPIGKGGCTCISVSSPDKLFVCKDYIVTHNTPFAIGLGRSFLEKNHFFYFIDAERATPKKWLQSLMGSVYEHPGFTMPEHIGTYEDVRKGVRKWCEGIAKARDDGKLDKDTTGIIVLDSLKKLTPANMFEELAKSVKDGRKGQEKGHVDGFGGRGGQYKAGLNAAWVDELTPLLAETNTCMAMITRESKSPGEGFFSKPVINTQGGTHIKYDSSLWLRVDDEPVIAKVGDDDKALVGKRHIIEIRRSKVKALHDEIVCTAYHTSNGVLCPEGFDRVRDVLELGLLSKDIEQNGAYYSFEGEVLGQGAAKVVEKLRTDQDLCLAIENKCRETLMAAA